MTVMYNEPCDATATDRMLCATHNRPFCTGFKYTCPGQAPSPRPWSRSKQDRLRTTRILRRPRVKKSQKQFHYSRAALRGKETGDLLILGYFCVSHVGTKK